MLNSESNVAGQMLLIWVELLHFIRYDLPDSTITYFHFWNMSFETEWLMNPSSVRDIGQLYQSVFTYLL